MSCSKLLYIDKDGKQVRKPKICYNTLVEANEFAKKLNSNQRQIHYVSAYKCKECGKFHVGKSNLEIERPKEIKKEFTIIVSKINAFLKLGIVTNLGFIKDEVGHSTFLMHDDSTREREELFPVKLLIKEVNPLKGFSDSYYEMYNGKLLKYDLSYTDNIFGKHNVYTEDGSVLVKGEKEKLIDKDDFKLMRSAFGTYTAVLK